jgi:predicted DNA-binding transcriptional regulator AlpA
MEKLLSPAEVAEEWLGIPLPTLYRWRYEGTGPVGIKCGRHVRYDPAEVRRWLAEHRDDRA